MPAGARGQYKIQCFLMNDCIDFHKKKKLKAEKNKLDSDIYVRMWGYHFYRYILLIILFFTKKENIVT